MSANPRAAKRGRSRTVEAFLRSARASNTVKAYASDLKDFQAWGGRIPARPDTVAEYLVELSGSRSLATIKRRKAAITAAHRERGYANPCASEVVSATLKGIRRGGSRARRQMRPLLAEQVMAAVEDTGTDMRGLRDRALLLIGFAGAFRRSELVALDVEDCGMRGRDLIVRLRRGKTDQEGEGREVVLPNGKAICPVRALKAWLRKAQIQSGPVFRRVGRDGLVGSARLPAGVVAQVVKAAAKGLGLDPSLYAGHSLRAGYVTTAALNGVPLWQIKKHTGHSTETMVETYVRDGNLKAGPSFL